MLVQRSHITCRALAPCIISPVLAILLSPVIIDAASIVIDQPGMKAIFSQASFGSTTIDIRFNAPRFIDAPDLLVIKDQADLQALVNLAPDPAPTVDAFFVDQIDACGFPDPDLKTNGYFAGCAQLPGHVFVEASNYAQQSAAPLMGHELAHNLDVHHSFLNDDYLMWYFFPPGREVTDSEVATMLQSPLVQTDSMGQRFIDITPIAIVATPEPSTLLLFGLALGGFFIVQVRRGMAAGM